MHPHPKSLREAKVSFSCEPAACPHTQSKKCHPERSPKGESKDLRYGMMAEANKPQILDSAQDDTLLDCIDYLYRSTRMMRL